MGTRNNLNLSISRQVPEHTYTYQNADGTLAFLSDVGYSGQATIDFGSVESSYVRYTVADTNAVTGSIILVCPSGIATADHDPDDYQWDEVSGYATNIVNGVSFDIIGVAPNGTWGRYTMNYIIK